MHFHGHVLPTCILHEEAHFLVGMWIVGCLLWEQTEYSVGKITSWPTRFIWENTSNVRSRLQLRKVLLNICIWFHYIQKATGSIMNIEYFKPLSTVMANQISLRKFNQSMIQTYNKGFFQHLHLFNSFQCKRQKIANYLMVALRIK